VERVLMFYRPANSVKALKVTQADWHKR